MNIRFFAFAALSMSAAAFGQIVTLPGAHLWTHYRRVFSTHSDSKTDFSFALAAGQNACTEYR